MLTVPLHPSHEILDYTLVLLNSNFHGVSLLLLGLDPREKDRVDWIIMRWGRGLPKRGRC